MNSKFIFLLLVLSFSPAWAKVSVVTTTTDLAWAARHVGGEWVEVRSLLTGKENPHYLDASPRFIRQVADADVLFLIGFDLEVGWLPKVLERSGNAKVQRGGVGFGETGRVITPLQRPAVVVDRSMGDVHALGNPHYWLSPTAFGEVVAYIGETLGRIDPEHAAGYLANATKLKESLDALVKRNLPKLAPWKGKAPLVIEYHQEFIYLFNQYGVLSLGSIEEKPGVLPSAGRLARIGATAKSAGIKVAFTAPYNPQDVLAKFHELSGVPVFTVPTSVQSSGPYSDYEALHQHMVDSLVNYLSGTSKGNS